MKIEARGKYPGVKVHLDDKEVEALLAAREYLKSQGEPYDWSELFTLDMGKKIKDLLKDQPDILKARTKEQIASALLKEKVAAEKKMEVLVAGMDWSKVKTTVEVEA